MYVGMYVCMYIFWSSVALNGLCAREMHEYACVCMHPYMVFGAAEALNDLCIEVVCVCALCK
jgi:hypothetical protein